MTSLRRLLARPGALLAALLLGVLVLTIAPATAQAAGTGAAGAAPTAPAVPAGTAWVRFGHFVPGMGAASISLEPFAGSAMSMALGQGATYSQVSAYESVAPGSYTATVRQSDADPDAAPLLSRALEVTDGDARTIAVVGTAEAPRLVLLTDDLTPPAAGTARVRLLSASEDAGAVTVRAVDGPTIATDAVLGQATGYAVVPAGRWDLEVQGTTATGATQPVAVDSGSVYTVVVLDRDDDQGVGVQVVTDAAGAVVAPRGGAATGGGWLARTAGADGPGAQPWGVRLGALLALLAGGTLTVLVARRRTGARGA